MIVSESESYPSRVGKRIKELREIVKNISEERNVTVLISSHILSEIENILNDEILYKSHQHQAEF